MEMLMVMDNSAFLGVSLSVFGGAFSWLCCLWPDPFLHVNCMEGLSPKHRPQ